MHDIQSFLKLLDSENELIHIHEKCDPTYEIPEIHRRVVSTNGKALLFHNVTNSSFPVATNLFGSDKRVALAFSSRPEKSIEALCTLLTGPMPPKLSTLWENKSHLKKLTKLGTKKARNAPLLECQADPVDLNKLPLLKLWPKDGGHFITLPLVYTESPDRASQNLGMYRIQRFDEKTTGLHFQIGKGGGFHYHEAERQDKKLPVTIFVGGPPALIMSAIAPLPENVPELVLASFLQEKKLPVTYVDGHPHPLIANCEFALLGYANPHERRLEGPFGDHFGYYSLAHDFPVFHCQKLFHRKNAIWPATVVGKPVQEDLFIGNFLQKLFNPIFPIVMPQVKELHTFAETGFHALCACKTRERYEKEALSCAFRILGEGQLSLTKCLFITDAPVDICDIKKLLPAILELFTETSLHIFGSTSNDTLDYTGPKLNHGSKMVLIGTGEKKRDLPRNFTHNVPYDAIVFCPGVLVVSGQNLTPEAIKVTDFPLVIIVDDAKMTTATDLEFLWTVFTRFEPARDFYATESKIERNSAHFCYPYILDCRMKAFYPEEVTPDPETIKLVDRKWDSLRIDTF